MALSRLVILSISSLIEIWILRLINSMKELINFMMQHFLPGVTLNMLFGHIKTLKLIILDILSKLNLLTRGLNSLTYLVYLKINLLSLLFLLIIPRRSRRDIVLVSSVCLSVHPSVCPSFENKESPIICYKYNKPIRSQYCLNNNKLVTKLDIENSTTGS